MQFRRPDGTVVSPHCESVPTTPQQAERRLRVDDPELEIDPATITGHYVGDPLDLHYAVGYLIDTEQPHDHRDYQDDGGFPPADTPWTTPSEPFWG